MALTHTVTVTIGEERLAVRVWEQYDVTLDLWSQGSPFTFTVSRSKENESAWHRIKQVLKFGAQVKVTIDNSVQLSGRIEDIATHTDRTGSKLSFAGRDLAGPAIDWDASPQARLRGQSLSDALTSLFEPLGLTVRTGASVDATRMVQTGTSHSPRTISHTRRRQRVDRSKPQPGERIWQVAERLCARLGYMIWMAPDADGAMSVIVDVPNYTGGAIFDLRRAVRNGQTTSDSNILSGGQRISTRNVPTEITVYTGAPNGDGGAGRIAAHIENLWPFNPDVMGGYETVATMKQPRHVRAQEARTQESALREAQHALSLANTHSRRYSCTVQGHGVRFGAGILHYAINCLAHVRDEWETSPAGDPLDEDMLIERVHFRGGRKIGTTTELTLHAKGAIILDSNTTGM